MLAVDLNKRLREFLQQRDAGWLVIDKNPAAPVRRLHPPQDDVAFAIEIIVLEEQACRMAAWQIKHCGDLALACSMTDQTRIAPRADGERKRVKQDRFARARLAGQHGKASRKLYVQFFDKDDVSDRKVGEHVSDARQAPAIVLAALEIHEPASSRGCKPPVCNSL